MPVVTGIKYVSPVRQVTKKGTKPTVLFGSFSTLHLIITTLFVVYGRRFTMAKTGVVIQLVRSVVIFHCFVNTIVKIR
jgi:hypothetical protein